MATIVIAHPSRTIRDLLELIVVLRGDTVLTHDLPGAVGLAPDALIVDPGWPPALRVAHGLRPRDPQLPVVCVSIRSVSPASRALSPVAHVRMPFRIAEVNAALDAALGLTCSR